MRFVTGKLSRQATAPNRLQAVVLDWAGTTVDFGSLAPVRALIDLFARVGTPITEEEARKDMGLLKRDHIQSILSSARVGHAWQDRTGRVAAECDVVALYEQFIPAQLSSLRGYSRLIPGVLEAFHHVRRLGLKVGSTTGYTRPMLELLVEEAKSQGYTPDLNLSPEDVAAGRPHPFMIFHIAAHLGISPLSSIVKVGDTPVDIAEGINAGCWSVGVALTGNMVGLSEEEYSQLTATDREARASRAREDLVNTGAHYVIDSLADLPAVLFAIDGRMANGERP
jgi:phosphonoacetaldehyde hydrolase